MYNMHNIYYNKCLYFKFLSGRVKYTVHLLAWLHAVVVLSLAYERIKIACSARAHEGVFYSPVTSTSTCKEATIVISIAAKL